jgi:hypothetical protein
VDVELQRAIMRYLFVGIVISAAAIATVLVVQDAKHENGVPLVVGSDAGPLSSEEQRPQTAPSLKSMFVERDGKQRVACAPACRLEAYCGLRAASACLAKSCDRDARIDAAGDLDFARAEDCSQAALAPCPDACARRVACGAVADPKCLELCRLRAQQLPGDGYRAARCVIEAKTCNDVAACN